VSTERREGHCSDGFVAIVFGAKPDGRFPAPIFRHVAHLSAAPFPIGGPFLGEKQSGFLWWQVDNVADVVRRHVYPINSIGQFFR
jgi:hypothetical protein